MDKSTSFFPSSAAWVTLEITYRNVLRYEFNKAIGYQQADGKLHEFECQFWI
jgi:hypothetical protein